MKTLSQLKKENFEGIDASLQISLNEYDIAIKPCNDNEFIVIYKVSEYEYDQIISTEPELLSPFFENWFNQKSFLSFTGQSLDQWQKQSLVNKLFDMVNYYGYENIFGSTYHTFKIDFEN